MSSKSQIIYFSFFAASFITLSVLHYIALQPATLYEQVVFTLLILTLLPLSYTTLHFILSVFPSPGGRLSREVPKRSIRVALIQPVYNDFSPEHTSTTLANNPGHDCWLLSDSDSVEEIRAEEAYCKENKIRILRRETRRGKKAGAINDWASNIVKYGYDYFVVLDKDSILGPKNVEELVSIGEHPDNSKVAIIQTSINSLEGETIYSRLTSVINNSLVSSTPKVDMKYLGGALYWGHNALIRSEAFIQVGRESE